MLNAVEIGMFTLAYTLCKELGTQLERYRPHSVERPFLKHKKNKFNSK